MSAEEYKKISEDWSKILELLPVGWESQARALGALKFGRNFEGPDKLLRVLLMYFCDGSGHRDRHFGEEWQETQPVSQFLAYASKVLFEDPENLYGGHAHWLRMRLRSGDGLMLEERATTLLRFQKGELAYKVTPVGGCVNPGPCDKNPIDVLHVNCVSENCKHLAGNLKKTERVILIKSRELEVLRKTNEGLPELIHEEAEFKRLIAGYNLAKAVLAAPKGDR